MPDYKAPKRDMDFVMYEMLNLEQHYPQLRGGEEVSRDLLDAIINEAEKFAVNDLLPMFQTADDEGCHFEDGAVTLPQGFVEAYKQYVANGWPSMASPGEYGGQDLPSSLGIFMSEMIGACNWAWNMYPGLSSAAIKTVYAHGSEEQKNTYLPKLIEGTWLGTMCLTESHCGSDVGQLRTKAVKQADGSYKLTGTKIFITGGDNDMAENLVHMVLARVEGAPAGTAGISLFMVPKFLPDADGNLGERNAAVVGSIEHKMGIKGSATCVLNFDGATAFIVGEENSGLSQMFTMMNAARLGTGMQGLASASLSYQNALKYANERLSMRSLTGPKNPDGPADPLIVHPDVRRMLLTMKSFVEGSRGFMYWLGQLNDMVERGPEEGKKETEDLLDLLTPIAKAFMTEMGNECVNHGLQIFGGHGYIKEWGMEQIVRDCRIGSVYEGTTGIQGLDLMGRKVLGTGGEMLRLFTKIVHKFCEANKDNEALKPMIEALAEKNAEWGQLTMDIGGKCVENADEVGAASVDYIMYSGYVVYAYIWAWMAQVANEKLADASDADKAFYEAKIQTAQFYFDRILPRTLTHAATARTGSENLMSMDVASFEV